MRHRTLRHLTHTAALVVLAGLFAPAPPAAAEAAPAPVACPPAVAELATCWSGQDANGAFYSIAVPADWNGDLVVHAHGGPDLGAASDPARSLEDLDRWSVMVREGYAWVGSAYRRGGFGTRMAVADTESARPAFVATFGEPARTLAHGQSWGGDVAAKLVEVHPTSYDGLLLTNGCSPVARAATTTGSTSAWSTSTTAATTRARPSRSTRSGWGCGPTRR